MFFIFSKIISFIFFPITWVFLLLAWAILSKSDKKRKKILWASVLVFYFFSNSFILDELNRCWEIPAITNEKINHFDAGIILSGMLAYDEKLDRIQFGRGSDRLWQGVKLYKEGRIKKIFFTGGSGSITYKNHKEGPLVKRYLISIGIPEDDIITENESKNTRENVIFSKKIIREEFPEGKLLLITSSLHMRRALACFEKEGMPIVAYSTDRTSGPRKFIFDHLFLPSSETLFSWNNLFHECIGYMSYWAMGYL